MPTILRQPRTFFLLPLITSLFFLWTAFCGFPFVVDAALYIGGPGAGYDALDFSIHHAVATGETETLSAPLEVTGSLAVSGTFNANGQPVTVPQALIVDGGSSFTSGASVVTLAGSVASYTSTNVDPDATTWTNGTLFIRSDLSQTLPSGETYGNLYLDDYTGGATTYTMGSTIEGDWVIYADATVEMTDDITVTGDVVVEGTLNTNGFALGVGGDVVLDGGTIAIDDSTISVAGNWDNSGGGTLTPGTGTVALTGTSQQVLGSTTFYNLTKTVASADTLTFGDGTTQTISAGGTLTLTGAHGAVLSLRTVSDDGVATFTIMDNGFEDVSFVDVKDAIATNGITATYAVDASGNTNWTFASHLVTSTANTLTAGTLRWAMTYALSDQAIYFDTTVFPSAAPATISVTTALPAVSQGNLTIDASPNAGG
ncbi:MAG: hypothetical protein GX606_05825, partial [Elusimicrobia bacterium]|nr:hypothetical protein [Elusimicrobiota bacterium]